MLASAVYTATDPCEYGPLVRGTDLQVVVESRGNFNASVTRVDLQAMWLQHGRENLPRIFRSTPQGNRIVVSFLAEPSSPAIRLGGIEVTPRQIAVLAPGRSSPWRSLGACEWRAMSLPTEDFISWGSTLAEGAVLPNLGG